MPTYGAAGNLKLVKDYPDSASPGSEVGAMFHDGLGRRIIKEVKNSADLDCTYHYYLDGQSLVEQRNGSDQVIKQQVWGVTYVDELVQVALNGGRHGLGERPEKIARSAAQ